MNGCWNRSTAWPAGWATRPGRSASPPATKAVFPGRGKRGKRFGLEHRKKLGAGSASFSGRSIAKLKGPPGRNTSLLLKTSPAKARFPRPSGGQSASPKRFTLKFAPAGSAPPAKNDPTRPKRFGLSAVGFGGLFRPGPAALHGLASPAGRFGRSAPLAGHRFKRKMESASHGETGVSGRRSASLRGDWLGRPLSSFPKRSASPV